MGRGVHEVKVDEIVDAEALEEKDDVTEVCPLYLGYCVVF